MHTVLCIFSFIHYTTAEVWNAETFALSYPVQPLHISFVITCFLYFAILNMCCSSILYLISCQVGKESTTMCSLSTDLRCFWLKTFALLPMTSIAHFVFAVCYLDYFIFVDLYYLISVFAGWCHKPSMNAALVKTLPSLPLVQFCPPVQNRQHCSLYISCTFLMPLGYNEQLVTFNWM